MPTKGKTNVWTVIYHHRFGVDAWSCKTEEGAIRSLADSVMEHIDESTNRERIQAAYDEEDYNAVLKLHFDEGHTTERYEINVGELYD